jgi:predicted outer membrane repeat protein
MPSNVVTSYGVGIYNRGSLIIDGTEVNENILNGYGGLGGGIYSTYGSLQILNESTIANNVIVSGNFPVPPDDADGGGIYSRHDELFIIRDSSIQGNYAGLADGSVGGIFVYGVGKELLVENVLISNNESVGLGGSTGGAFFYNPDGVTTIRNSTIQENISSDADDGTTGGIEIVAAGGDVVVESSVIQNNFAGDPAGPYTGASTGGIDISAFNISIEDTVIFGNTGQDDGGMTINQANSFSLISSSVISNSAIGTGKGGGLTIKNTQLTSIENSTFAQNFANEHGGAIYFSAGYNEKLIITNSTFSNNTAGLSESGGAIYTAFSSVIINNSTFVNNFAGGSPNMIKVTDADVVFRNSLISDMPFIVNPSHCVMAVGGSATISSDGYNLESGSSCGFTQPGDIQNATAQVSPLSNNGGLTQTHSLPAGHDAIDGGDPLGCYADFDGDGIAEALLTKDQRGYPRPLDGDGNSSAFCDIGAFEYP